LISLSVLADGDGFSGYQCSLIIDLVDCIKEYVLSGLYKMSNCGAANG